MRSVLLTICANLLLIAPNPALASSKTPAYLTRWQGGNGAWTDAAKWTSGPPSVLREAVIGGLSEVTIPPGKFQAAMLLVGTEADDRAQVHVNGGDVLIRQDSLIVGEYSGGTARFVLNSGSVEDAMDIFVGGATGSSGRMNTSSLAVRG